MSARIVSREDWLAERKDLLAREKAFMRDRDALSAARRDLPWVRIDTPYEFDGPDGTLSLADLFDGRAQLIVQHFMFGPDWEAGCPSCSFWADGYDGFVVHLNQRDASFVAVSNAPLKKLLAFRDRMGWRFPWVSSKDMRFSRDFNVTFTEDDRGGGDAVYNYQPLKADMSELPGTSIFAKGEDGAVYHTYSCYARGLDNMNAAYQYLDLLPKGRNEQGLPHTMAWVRRHDEYDG